MMFSRAKLCLTLLACAGVALLSARPAEAITIDFSGLDWGGSYSRVFIGGGGDAAWTTFDAGGCCTATSNQWVHMNTTAALAQIPVGDVVTSATLSFAGAKFVFTSGVSATSPWSIFAVPDAATDLGRAAVIASGAPGQQGDDLVDYYASNTAYGLVDGLTEEFTPQAFDVTALFQGWNTGSNTISPGHMMLVGGEYLAPYSYVRWGNEDVDTQVAVANRPTLTIETTPAIPEPSSLILVVAGMASVFLSFRRQK